MPDNILDKYRRTPLMGREAASIPNAPDEYAAFVAKDKVGARLKIRRAGDPTHAASYGCLMNITYDELQGTHFTLLFSYMMVLVRGRCLQEVASAISAGTAEYIQEFDADRWAAPKSPKAPFIESIQVFADKEGPSLDNQVLSFDPPPKNKMH